MLLRILIVQAFVSCGTTMPSAEFCCTLRVNCRTFSPGSVTSNRPPAIILTAVIQCATAGFIGIVRKAPALMLVQIILYIICRRNSPHPWSRMDLLSPVFCLTFRRHLINVVYDRSTCNFSS